jgi:hypothetical protein
VDNRQLTPRRWPLLPLVAVTLAAGALTGGLVVAAGTSSEASAAADAAPVPPAPAGPVGGVDVADAALAMQAQALQAALATWGLQASLVTSHEASHAASLVLRRHEASLEGVALAADAAGDPRAAAIARLARAVAAQAAAGRAAAHSERDGDAGVLRLQALAAEVQATSTRLASALGSLAAASDPEAYAAALAAMLAELERSRPDGMADRPGGVPGDDPVPAAP